MKTYTLDIQFNLPNQGNQEKDRIRVRQLVDKNIKDFFFWNSNPYKQGIVICIMKHIDKLDQVKPTYQEIKQRLKTIFKEVKFDVIRILCNLKN